MLSSFFVFALSSGFLLIFIVGTYVDFFTVPLIILVLPIIFVISIVFLPDTPASLISRKKNDEAFESLKFYRSFDDTKHSVEALETEFAMIKISLETKIDEKFEITDFSK